MAQTDEAVNTWYQHWVAEGLRGLEKQARQSSLSGDYLFGDSVTLADICLLPQISNAQRFKCDMEAYPTLEWVSRHLERLPAFAAAAPEMQPDAAGG